MRKGLMAAVALGAALIIPATGGQVQAAEPPVEQAVEQIVLPPLNPGGGSGSGSGRSTQPAAPANAETADGVKAAARRVAGTTGRGAGERVDIIGISGAFVAARVYGPLGSDPVVVYLRQDGVAWQGVAEADAPAGLADLAAAYTGAGAAAAFAAVGDRTAREFFGYCVQLPAAANVELDKTPNNSYATITYAGWGNALVVKPLDYYPGRPLDAWGFDFLRDAAERAERSSFADTAATPVQAAFFRTGSSDVMMVDWQEGGEVRREWFTTPKGAGVIVRASTLLGAGASNPALVVAIQSLRIGDCSGVDSLSFSDAHAGFIFDYPAAWAATGFEGHNTTLGPAGEAPAVQVRRLSVSTPADAAAALGAEDAVVEDVAETLNGMPAVRVRWSVDGAERVATVAELPSGTVVAIIVLQPSAGASTILATFSEYQTA